MAEQKRIYSIGCCGSGWGIWKKIDEHTAEKIYNCRSHLEATEKLYELMGWRFNMKRYLEKHR